MVNKTKLMFASSSLSEGASTSDCIGVGLAMMGGEGDLLASSWLVRGRGLVRLGQDVWLSSSRAATGGLFRKGDSLNLVADLDEGTLSCEGALLFDDLPRDCGARLAPVVVLFDRSASRAKVKVTRVLHASSRSYGGESAPLNPALAPEAEAVAQAAVKSLQRLYQRSQARN